MLKVSVNDNVLESMRRALRKLTRFWAVSLLLATPIQAFGKCEDTRSVPGLERFYSQTWGTEYNGQRFQPAANTSINAANAPKLELKWAYGFSTDEPRSYPLVTEDTIFIGDGGRGLVALDRENGCVRWVNTEIEDISTAIVSEVVDGRTLLFFSSRNSGVFAVEATDGKIVWQRFVDDHNPVPMFSGSPIVYKDKVFVPISSLEVALALNPFYGCCTTSGGMAALDSATGELVWYLPTVPDEAKESGSHFFFIEEYGPSGAPVWGAPMLDTNRRLLFYGTGQNYSRPASLTSDAIFAVRIDTGEIAWVEQFTAGDAYNLACGTSIANCPEPMGPDVDFGAPPLLVELESGEGLLVAGQKSGDVYGLDPDNGKTIWSTQFGRGGPLGGVHWGIAANPEMGLVFIPISDISAFPKERSPQPGLFALDYTDGRLVWSVEREAKCDERKCWPGLSAAITAGPDIVVVGGLDGWLEIYRAEDGELLWSYDTITDFPAINEIPTNGGTIDAHGPMLADDLLIISSGYGSFGQQGGNALLVFAVPEERAPEEKAQ